MGARTRSSAIKTPVWAATPDAREQERHAAGAQRQPVPPAAVRPVTDCHSKLEIVAKERTVVLFVIVLGEGEGSEQETDWPTPRGAN